MENKKTFAIMHIYLKKLFSSKENLISIVMLFLTNIFGFSFLLFIKNVDTPFYIKITTDLDILFFVFLINILIFVIATVFINNLLFYNPLNSGLINMEIIRGYSKNSIWFSRFLVQKIWTLVAISSQIIIVNIILIFYSDIYNGLLMSQRLYWWFFLFFIALTMDLFYHLVFCLFSQQALLVVALFFVGLFFTLSLFLNTLSKSEINFGKGESQNNLSYRQIENSLKNFELYQNKFDNNSSQLIKDFASIKIKSYLEKMNNQNQDIIFLFDDNFEATLNSKNSFVNLIKSELKFIENNRKTFTLSYSDISNLDRYSVSSFYVSILNNFALLKNDNFYSELAKEYQKKIEENEFSLSNLTFIQSLENFSFIGEDISKYSLLFNNPEIILLINFYKNSLDSIYKLYDLNEINYYIYSIYLQQHDPRDAFFIGVKWDFFNQMSNLLYGYNSDYKVDFVRANSAYAPLSNLFFKTNNADAAIIDRYRSNDFNLKKLARPSENYTLNSNLFLMRSWGNSANIQEVMDFTENLISYFYPQIPFSLEKWDIVYHLKSGLDPNLCKDEPNVSLNKINNNLDAKIKETCDVVSVDVRARNKEYNNTQDSFMLYSTIEPTEFASFETKVDNDFNIDIYSDNIFNYNQRSKIFNYFGFFIPWLIVISVADVSIYFLFVKRYEKIS